MLSDFTIKKLCKENQMIKPYDEKRVQPCSYDLRLGDGVIKQEYNSIKRRTEEVRYSIKKDMMQIYPGDFLLGTTIERVNIPDNVGAEIVGKSSIGRLGLQVQNAGHLDPGFSGQITLELYNSGNYILDLRDFLGKEICQIRFHELDRPCERAYKGHYQEQEDVTESWLKK